MKSGSKTEERAVGRARPGETGRELIGRVPAAFNGIVGLKPTRGLLSNAGIVPACRSLDCVAIMAHSAEDAARVLEVARGVDPDDHYSREGTGAPLSLGSGFRFGVPGHAQREFFGDAAATRLYEEALDRLEALGGQRVEIDLAPFRAAAELLYAGPWVAERLHAIGPFLERHPEDVHPVVRAIVGKAATLSAVEVFEGMYRLEALRRAAAAQWAGMDVLALPTTGTIYRHAALEADPIRRSDNLGYYTNFVNLLDCWALAVPENLYGHDAISAFRQGRPNVDLRRTLANTVITTYGLDLATANTEFVKQDSGRHGRQSQTWVRTEAGWRVVSAHVSFLPAHD